MDRMVALNQNGIYSALFSPLGSRGELDKERLKALVQFEMDHGAEGFYCCGSSGEGLLLETEERKAVAEIVAGEVKDRLPIVVHTGALSTRTAIELSSHAKECGAAAVSLIPPIYYNYSIDEIEQYYKDVLDAVDIGIIVYNIPQFTGVSFSKKNVFLKDKRIIGIKHTSMNLYDMERIKQAFPDKIIFSGFDEIFLSSLTAGADAAIGLTVNIFPKLFIAIREEFQRGNISGARDLQRLINDFVEVIVSAGVFSAAKYCLALQGVDVGPCRKPFAPLTEEGKKQAEQALKKIENWL
jgi:N-acetylneuraminate lyase